MKRSPEKAGEDPAFREAMKDVAPIAPTNRVEPWRVPAPPIPHKRNEDERAVLAELARLTFDDDVELEDDSAFLRPGLPRDILKKLKRTHWVVQDELDLHGHTGDEAALETAAFIADCRKRGLRCVRIVHGKGLRSGNRGPVLKAAVSGLLRRSGAVLAYVSARPVDGGSGALYVLLAPR